MKRSTTFEVAQRIRKEYAKIPENERNGALKRLGGEFSLDRQTVWKIVHGKSYAEKTRKPVRNNAKLTKGDVRDIRALAASHIWNNVELADKYDVHPSTIGLIVRKKIWKDVE